MIHREDVIGAIIAALEHGRDGEIYNVADDEPVTQRDLFAWLAKTLNRPLPPSVAVEETEGTGRRGVTSKRVSNRRMHGELRYAPVFPTFREGYSAELARLARAG